LETSGKPWVSAINGTCMGGATEAFHGLPRPASPRMPNRSRIALPEVKVGILPGAGGTQRLPRLINTQDALQIMTTGQDLSASRAKALGLLNDVVEPEKLIETAKALIKNGLDPVAPWDKKGFKAPGGTIWSPQGVQLFSAANAILRRETSMNYPGAHAILKCVYEGLQLPFDTALKVELRYFIHILQSTEARSMIRSLFVSMQELGKGARRPVGIPSQILQDRHCRRRFHGAAVAYCHGSIRHSGSCCSTATRRRPTKARPHSETLVKDAIAKGKSTKEEGEKLLSLITASADYALISDADMVIEAVFEDRGVKKAVIEQVEAVLPATSIFASNTSTLRSPA